MEFRQLGNSGLQVSAIGLGTNTFGRYTDAEGSAAIIHRALDLGANFIDTANMYSRGVSEEHIGRAVKGLRHQVIVATKVGAAMGEGPNQRGNSRQHIMEQAHESLRRLQTDYIDLYQIHFLDPKTPIEETLRALDDLVHQGKVRYLGCSNFAAWQVCEAVWTARSCNLNSFVSVQPRYNLLDRSIERELIPFCQAYGIGIIPYRPLAGGFLTGEYPDIPVPEGPTERNFTLLSQLKELAEGGGHTVSELAIAWLLAQPVVSTVIVGATGPQHVEANIAAGLWKLSAEEVAKVNEITGRT